MKYLYNEENNRCVPYSSRFAESRPDFVAISEDELVMLQNGKRMIDILRCRTNIPSVSCFDENKSKIDREESIIDVLMSDNDEGQSKSDEGISFAPPVRRRGRRKKTEI